MTVPGTSPVRSTHPCRTVRPQPILHAADPDQPGNHKGGQVEPGPAISFTTRRMAVMATRVVPEQANNILLRADATTNAGVRGMATHRGPTGTEDLQCTGRPCLRSPPPTVVPVCKYKLASLLPKAKPLLQASLRQGQTQEGGARGRHAQADHHSERSGPGPGPLATRPHAHGWRGSTFNTVSVLKSSSGAGIANKRLAAVWNKDCPCRLVGFKPKSIWMQSSCLNGAVQHGREKRRVQWRGTGRQLQEVRRWPWPCRKKRFYKDGNRQVPTGGRTHCRPVPTRP